MITLEYFFSSCECPDGKFGVTCEEESSACTTGRHNCAEGFYNSFQNLFYFLKSITNFNQPLLNLGSECTVMKDGNYECLCPLGKTGKFCRDSISISDPLFTGKHSFMSLNLDTHIRFNTEVSIYNNTGFF